MRNNIQTHKWRPVLVLYAGVMIIFILLSAVYFPARAFLSAPSDKRVVAEKGYIDLSYDLDDKCDNVYSIGGEWLFFPDKLYLYEDLKELPGDEGYYVTFPHLWKDDPRKTITGYGTYVMEIKVPGDFANIGIYSRYQFSAFDIYIDESYVCGVGTVNADNTLYKPNFMPASGYISHNDQQGYKTLKLIVHIQNHTHNASGLSKNIYIGSRNSVNELQAILLFFNGLLSGGLFLLFVSFILIYMHGRDRRGYLDYSLVALMALYLSLTNAGEALMYRVIADDSSFISVLFIMRLEYSVLIVGAFFANYNALRKYLADRKTLLQVIYVIMVLILIFHLFAPSLILTKFPAVNMVFASSLFIIPLSINLIDAIKRRSASSLVAALSFSTIFIGMALYMLGVYPWDSIDLLSLSIIIHCLLQMGIFLRRYSQTEMELKQLTETLEVRIDERTEELSFMAQKASEATTAKSSFLATMSHEIRTPMNAIIGMSDLISTENLDEVQKRYFDDIKSSSKALLNIINDILDFSKIEAGKLELIPAHFNFLAMFDNICSLSYFQAEAKDLSFRSTFASDVPEVIYGDETRYRQIILNVVNNAIKYTHSGHVHLAVRLFISDGQEYLDIKIEDTGVGIKPEDKSVIFDIFQQVDGASNRKIIGTGLGLAITKMLVELMYGEIFFESEYGKGSVFTILIPLVRGDKSKLDIQDEIEPIWVEESTKVLVVDDNSINLTVALGFLATHGIKAETARSGFDAIKMMEAKQYDIVFMDHMMPEMDGVETTRRIREDGNKQMKEVPIIALTANAVSGTREMFLSSGMNDFVSKPIVASRLNAVLSKWLPVERINQKHVNTNANSGDPRDPRDDEMLKKLSDIDGLKVDEALERMANSKKTYLTILRQFCVELEAYNSTLNRAMESRNWKDYVVRIHGIKGALLNLGADSLARSAYDLEISGRNGDYDKCLKYTDGYMKKVFRLRNDIMDTGVLELEKKTVSNMDKEELIEILSKLKNALMVGHSELAEQLVESIGYYNDEIKESLQDLETLVEAFDYAIAAKRCDEVIKKLELP